MLKNNHDRHSYYYKGCWHQVHVSEYVEDRVFTVIFVKSIDNGSDISTKNLRREFHAKHIKKDG